MCYCGRLRNHMEASYYCPVHQSKLDRPMHLIPPSLLGESTQASSPISRAGGMS